MKFLYLNVASWVVVLAGVSPTLAFDLKMSDAVITEQGSRTRFELPLSAAVEFATTVVSNPERIIINLPDLACGNASGSRAAGQGLISAYGCEIDATGSAQIILQTSKPTTLGLSAVTPGGEGVLPHLILDLIARSDEPTSDTFTTGSTAPAPTPAPVPKKNVIVIDPGHGGIDPGAISPTGAREKDLVLTYAKHLRQVLETTGHYEVLLTRSTDHFVKLDERVTFARNHHAELFIAIHADMLKDRDVRGTTVYTVSDKASDFEAEALAQKENGADAIAGFKLPKQKQNVASALMNLAARESKSEAMSFAQKTVAAVRSITELSTNPLRSAAFVVLKAPDIPSVLVELGYLSNTDDQNLLSSVEWRGEMAEAMAKAIDIHFRRETASAAP